MTDDIYNGEIAVVKSYYAVESAYKMGHSEWPAADSETATEVNFGHFTESAKWANVIAPRLRAMAGHEDGTGRGTYTTDREIASIIPGCEEDEPAEADMMRASDMYDRLVDAFRQGAEDAAAGVKGEPEPETF